MDNGAEERRRKEAAELRARLIGLAHITAATCWTARPAREVVSKPLNENELREHLKLPPE